MPVPYWAVLLSALLVSVDTSDAAPLRSMKRIPETTLSVGTDLDGIIRATEQCSRERKTRPCLPEEFAFEQTSGRNTRVASFYLDQTEVSVSDYEQCVRAGKCQDPPYERLPLEFRAPDLPVVLVTHSDAAKYCDFRGARLPSEAEYEAAARGPGLRTFPWGLLDNQRRANSGSSSLATSDDEDGHDLLAPVGDFGAGRTPQGVLQLAGNVAEWTSTGFGPHGESAKPGEFVVKGGSFASPRVQLRATSRIGYAPGTREPDIGFRCALAALVKSAKDR